MGLVHCGICERELDDIDTKTKLYCPSCMSFRLLKYNINNINIKEINSKMVHDINRVLDVCFGDNYRKYLELYLQGHYKFDNLEGTDVSIDSIARLALMLLNVEMMRKIKGLDSVARILREKEEKNEILRSRIRLLKKTTIERKSMLDIARIDFNKLQYTKHKDVKETLNYMNDNIVLRQLSRIRERQQSMIFDIFILWNIEIIETNQLSILLTPIIGIDKIHEYTLDLTLESLMKSAIFVSVVAQALQVYMPYQVGVRENDLRVGDKIFRFKGKMTIEDLDKLGLMEFCIGLSQVVLNIVTLLKYLIPGFLQECPTFATILQYDALIIRIIDSLKRLIQYDKIRSTNIRLLKEKSRQHQTAIHKQRSKGWFFSKPTKDSQNKEGLNETELPIKSYKLRDSGAFKQALSLRRDRACMDTTVSSTSHPRITIPPSAQEGLPLLHDHRALAEALYTFIRGR